MQYDLDALCDRFGTNCLKWDFMGRQNPFANTATLPLWVADMDFPCPQGVLDALHARVDRGIFGYSSQETGRFYRSVCGWFWHRFGWYVRSDDILYSPGIVPALGYLISIMTHEGDGVLLQPPVYRPFLGRVEAYGRVPVCSPLVERDNGYTVDFEDFERKAKDPKVTLFLLCSPHNPVGRVWREDELRRMGEICFENGVRIIADEIHHDIVLPGARHTPIAKLFPERRGDIVTGTAVSKTFNLAGMGFSNIVVHDPHLKALCRDYVQRHFCLPDPNPLSIAAVQAAYETGEDWLRQVIGYIEKNLRFVQAFLGQSLPKARMHMPEGTYFAWINVSAYLDEEMRADIDSYLVRSAGVLAEDGAIFGPGGEGWLRVNTACPRRLLEEGMKRIAQGLLRTGREPK